MRTVFSTLLICVGERPWMAAGVQLIREVTAMLAKLGRNLTSEQKALTKAEMTSGTLPGRCQRICKRYQGTEAHFVVKRAFIDSSSSLLASSSRACTLRNGWCEGQDDRFGSPRLAI
jgi:hypothetical protein